MADDLRQQMQTAMNSEAINSMLKNVQAVRKDELYKDDSRKNILRYMDMANALHNEVNAKYSDLSYQQRFDKVAEKYEELFVKSPGLFQAAIRGTLYEGESGKVVKAFQAAQGDPKTIYKNIGTYIDGKADEAIQSIERFRKAEEMKTNEKQRVEEIIQKHQQARNSSSKPPTSDSKDAK